MLLPAMNNSFLSLCDICGSGITDRFYLLVGSRKLHNGCLKCKQCKLPLSSNSSCYEKEGEIYCKECYFRKFSMAKCIGCSQGISHSDLVMQAKENYYHVQCFRCSYCEALLQKGQKFGIRSRHLFCEEHYVSGCRVPSRPTSAHSGALIQENRSSPDKSQQIIIKEQAMSYSQPRVAMDNCSTNENIHEISSPTNVEISSKKKELKLPNLLSCDKQEGDQNQLASTPTLDSNKSISAFKNTATTSILVGKFNQTVKPEFNRSVSSSTSSGDEDKIAGTDKIGEKSKSKVGKRKRNRTTFKPHQLVAMKELFDQGRNPDSNSLENLSQKIELSKRVLQVWFQNARAKHRKGQSIFSDEKLCSSTENKSESKLNEKMESDEEEQETNDKHINGTREVKES